MLTPSNQLFKIMSSNEVFNLPETQCMYSEFSDNPNITKDDLLHLLSGKPIIDLSDGEYIHWFQLDEGALRYLKDHLS